MISQGRTGSLYFEQEMYQSPPVSHFSALGGLFLPTFHCMDKTQREVNEDMLKASLSLLCWNTRPKASGCDAVGLRGLASACY